MEIKHKFIIRARPNLLDLMFKRSASKVDVMEQAWNDGRLEAEFVLCTTRNNMEAADICQLFRQHGKEVGRFV